MQNDDLPNFEASATLYEGLASVSGDIRQHRRYYTYATEHGVVAAYAVSVMFQIDRPARQVWPIFKDFNLWQNAYGHYYSGIIGDLQGKSYTIADRPGVAGPYEYHVLRVIPEHLIVASEPPPPNEGVGAVSRGFHVFMLNEHENATTITILMQHARQSGHVSPDEALRYWRDMAPELQMKWRDIFIPNLKRLVWETDRR